MSHELFLRWALLNMLEYEEHREAPKKKRRAENGAKSVAERAKEIDPEFSEELKKAAMRERVDVLKNQLQQHTKNVGVMLLQIQQLQKRLAELRAELQLPPPTEDAPSVKRYQERVKEMQNEIKKIEEELKMLI